MLQVRKHINLTPIMVEGRVCGNTQATEGVATENILADAQQLPLVMAARGRKQGKRRQATQKMTLGYATYIPDHISSKG